MAMNLNEIESLIKDAMPDAIVEINKKDQKKVLDILNKNAVHYDELGTIHENMLFFNEKTKVTIDELKGFNTKWLKEYMSN